MKIHPSLMFSGTCGDAFRRYASLFGGDIVLLLNPDAVLTGDTLFIGDPTFEIGKRVLVRVD